MDSESKTAKVEDSKPNSHEKLRNKWLLYSGGGLTLVGLGLCLFGEALHLKHTEAVGFEWVLYGTLSLVVFNAGLTVFGQAVVFKSQLDYKKNRKKFNQKRYGNKSKGGGSNNNPRSRKPKTTQFTPREID